MPRGHRDWGRVDHGIPNVNELDTYISTNSPTVPASSSLSLLSMFNPANSVRVAHIRQILLILTPEIEAEGAGTIVFQLLRSTSAGTGSAITPRPTHQTAPPASVTVNTGTTVAPTDAFGLIDLPASMERRTIPQEALFSAPNMIVPLYHHAPGSAEAPLTIDPSEGLHLTALTSGPAWSVQWIVRHTEAPI